ncbi:uncharacterized protein FN964_011708 [Alca torda]
MELDGSEARQLGNLAREGGIDKALGKKSQTLSLWRRLVSAVKGRYPFKDDIECRPTKWTNIEKGIKYLREMAVKEVIYGDWEVNVDPDEMPCRKPMLRKFVQSAPPMYSHTLSVLIWGGDDDDSLTVNEVASRMRQYEDSLSRPLTVAAVEKLTEKTEKLFDKLFDKLSRMEQRSYSPPARTRVAAIRRRPHPPRPTQRKQNTLRNILWSCLCDYGEDMTAECRPQFAFTWRGVQYTWNRLPQGWKHSPTICHGLIQTALEKGGAPEHLQYIDDIIVWGNTAEEVFKKGKKIIKILLKAGFAIKRGKVKGPAREIQFLGIKWQDGRRQIPMDVINKITSMSPPTNKKETQAFLGVVGFWRLHIPGYSQIVKPLYEVTRKKNEFAWGPEQRQAFEQIKQEIVHAVALGPVRTGQDIKNVLYTAAGDNGPTWSLWQKAPGETRGRPLGFWSRGYRGSEANYTPTEKEILAAYEGVRAASEVIGTEAQLLLAPRLPVLGWMFKGKVPSTHHATDATWSKWVALITQRARIGNPNRPGIVEVITNWPEGKDSTMPPEEVVTRAEEAPPYNELSDNEKQCVLFTDGSCRIVGKHRKWKAAVWSPTRRVAEATEGEGESSQFAEVKAIQLALDIAEREKWPILYLYTDSWMVANALWGWLKQWKQSNWQRRGKPIWAAELWQDIAERLGKLVVKVRHVDAHIPMSRATEEHQNNQQVDKAAKIFQTDLDWEHKGELFLARWAHDTSGHQGRDATYKWARDRGVDLTMDAIAQVIHDCETCAEIKQAKRLKPLWYGGRWLKYKYGEAWQIDYITLPQTRQGKRYVLTMVEASTGWLETYAVPHATARNTILGLERQVLWRHGTPERIESDNGTHFKNNLISAWAKEHGIEWVYHIPYHAPASGKIERYNGLLKTTLKSMGGGTFKNWDKHLAQATWLVNTRGSINRAGPAQSDLLHNIEGDKVPVVHERNMLGKAVWVSPTAGKGKPIRGTVFAQGPGCTWWVMMENGEVQCVPQGNLTLGENTQL